MSLIDTLHKMYKLFISPALEGVFGVKCRYYPHCSDYAVEAVKVHGWVRGIFIAGKRFLRCAPYCKGGYDPVPIKSKLAYPRSLSNNNFSIVLTSLERFKRFLENKSSI